MEKLTISEARQYSPLTLAFLGDSAYEIEVRMALVSAANMPVRKLHTEKIRYVCAAFQHLFEEKKIFRIGRNFFFLFFF